MGSVLVLRVRVQCVWVVGCVRLGGNVCACVCVCVCVRACVCVPARERMRWCRSLYVFVRIFEYICTCTRAHVCVCVRARVSVCSHVGGRRRV